MEPSKKSKENTHLFQYSRKDMGQPSNSGESNNPELLRKKKRAEEILYAKQIEKLANDWDYDI